MELGAPLTPAYIRIYLVLSGGNLSCPENGLNDLCSNDCKKEKKNSLGIRMLVMQSVLPSGHFSITQNYQVKLVLHRESLNQSIILLM